MNKEDLIQFLKDNLKVSVEYLKNEWNTDRPHIVLKNDNQVISKTELPDYAYADDIHHEEDTSGW